MKCLNETYQGTLNIFPDSDKKTEYLSFQTDAKGIICFPLLSASNLNNQIIHSSARHRGSKRCFRAKYLTGERHIAPRRDGLLSALGLQEKQLLPGPGSL